MVKNVISKRPQVIRTAADLRIEIERHSPQIKAIAIDIFNTVLERDTVTIEDYHKMLARRIVRTLMDRFDIDRTVEDIIELFKIIENNSEPSAINAQPFSPYRFTGFAETLANDLIKNDQIRITALTERISAHLLAVETETFFARLDIARILEWLNYQNIRVIAISDMPFDPAHLQNIFKRQGSAVHFDHVYVYPPHNSVNQSQQFFTALLQQQELHPHELFYIRSARPSNARVPATMSIPTVIYEDIAYSRQTQTIRIYRHLAQKNAYWRGRHLMQLIRPAAARSFHFNYGYEILGPIYATFILGVIEVVKQHHIKRVFFLAREGELFMKLFNELCPDFFEPDQIPSAHYLYVSRQSTASAAAHRGLSHEVAITPLFNPKQQGWHSIFQAFNLPPDAFTSVCRNHGYPEIRQPIADWESVQFREMLDDGDFQTTVRQHAEKNWRLLQQYLIQQQFFTEKKIAIVDIGWNGTSQKFLQEAFGQDENYPHVMGLYFGFIGGRKYQFDSKKNTLLGILCDERNKTRPGDIFSRFEEIFEEGARALHPTTIGYQFDQQSDTIIPIFKPPSGDTGNIESTNNHRIAEIQAGVLDFTSEFARAIDLTGYRLDDIKPFILTLAERAVAFPTAEECSQLMQLEHSEDFGTENTMNFQHEKFNNRSVLLKPRNFIRTLKNANWKYGTVASLSFPGFNTILRLYDLFKSK
ncbi:hypothetical protein [Nitrosomonas sp. wSCUT-2]